MIIFNINSNSMKVFKFPSWQSVQKQNKNPFRPEEKYLIVRQGRRQSKYSLEKKASSLDSNKYSDYKKMQLESAYSANKKQRTKSHANILGCYFNTTPQRPQRMAKHNSYSRKQLLIHEKKLTLKDNKSKLCFNEIDYYVEGVQKKLRGNLMIQSQKLFNEEFKQTLTWFRELQTQKNQSYEVLKSMVSCLIKCEERRAQGKANVFYDSISRLEKEKANLSLENKKLNIKIQAQQNQIENITEKNIELSKQMKKLRDENRKKDSANFSAQTDFTMITNEFQANEQYMAKSGQTVKNLEMGKSVRQEMKNPEEKGAIVKLIKEIREFKDRERQMTILLNQLKRQGVDLSSVYVQGVKNMNKQKQNEKIGQEVEESDYSEESNNEFLNYFNFYEDFKQEEQKMLNKKHYHKMSEGHKRGNKTDKANEYDADNSIIDDIDALSFNYEDKELSMEEYTPRRVYECKKPLKAGFKEKLALNFNVLYEEESLSQSSQKCPTI